MINHKSRKSMVQNQLGPILPSGHSLIEAILPAYSRHIMEQYMIRLSHGITGRYCRICSGLQ